MGIVGERENIIKTNLQDYQRANNIFKKYYTINHQLHNSETIQGKTTFFTS